MVSDGASGPGWEPQSMSAAHSQLATIIHYQKSVPLQWPATVGYIHTAIGSSKCTVCTCTSQPTQVVPPSTARPLSGGQLLARMQFYGSTIWQGSTLAWPGSSQEHQLFTTHPYTGPALYVMTQTLLQARLW